MSRFCPMVFQPEHLWPVPAADKLSRNLGRLVSWRQSGRSPPERHLCVRSKREGGVTRTLIGTSWIGWPVVMLSLAASAASRGIHPANAVCSSGATKTTQDA